MIVAIESKVTGEGENAGAQIKKRFLIIQEAFLIFMQ